MEKYTIDELREILKKLGHSDEEIEEVLKEQSKETSSDDSKDKESDESDAPAEDTSVQDGDTTPASDDVPPASEGDVPPADPDTVVPEGDVVPPAENDAVPPAPEGDQLPPGVENVNPADLVGGAPAPEEPTAAPVPDATALIGELQGKLDESAKTIEGLKNRIDLLENALKEAGIMSEGSGSKSSDEVGIDDGTRTPEYVDDETVMEDVLAAINRKR